MGMRLRFHSVFVLAIGLSIGAGLPACGGDELVGGAVGLADTSNTGDGGKTGDSAKPVDGTDWADGSALDAKSGSDTATTDGVNDGGSGKDTLLAQDVLLDGGLNDTDGGPELPEPEPGGLGWPCVAHIQCNPGGFCAGIGPGGDGEGVCATMGCSSHAECLVASDEPFCCVAYKDQTYCLPQAGATQCGGQDQEPGESCKDGGQSDCKTGQGDFCLQTGVDALCVSGCQQQSDCPGGHHCKIFPNGDGACIPFTANTPDGSPCDGVADCDAGQWCIGQQPGDPQAFCAKPCDKTPTGDACSTEQWCADFGGGGLCLQSGAIAAGNSCAGDRFGCVAGTYCWAPDNALAATCLPMCDKNSDCTDIAASLGMKAVCQKGENTKGLCVPQGELPPLSSCGGQPFACAAGSVCVGGYDVYNPDAFCQQLCGLDTTPPCPKGFSCTLFGDTGLCQPSTGKGQGESCDAAPSSCAAGHLCVGPKDAEQCAKLCQSSGECGNSLWCAPLGPNNGICLPSGELAPGASCVDAPFGCVAGNWCAGWGQSAGSSCIAPCPASGTCGSGLSCMDYGNAGKWCEAAGTIGQDGDCSKSPSGCAAGHTCIAENTDHAICAASCTTDSDCASGHWCAEGQWGGWCLPAGSVADGASCYGDAWSCSAGLLCIGDADNNPASVCSKPCAGFAAVCGPGAKCQAFGSGQAYCLQTGSAPAGDSCLADPGSCNPQSLCIKGTPLPTCLQQCGFGWPACPADHKCTAFPGSAVQLCVPPGFTPFGPVQVPI